MELFLASVMSEIIKANFEHIYIIAPLLDKYRIFYGQNSNIDLATRFLQDRVSRNESIIFLAFENDTPVGFTQLYTTYSSVTLQSVFILNDLYVDKNHRGSGIGEALLNKAKEFCREMNYKGLALETAIDNPAQKLYEKLGWKKDTASFHYFWTCD